MSVYTRLGGKSNRFHSKKSVPDVFPPYTLRNTFFLAKTGSIISQNTGQIYGTLITI